MHFGHRPARFNRTIQFGNVMLIAANVSNRLLMHHWHVAEGTADGVTGLLFGISIGLYILGIRKAVRSGGGTGAQSCA
jgi:hypothetical protein